jgi:hypothetical protein
MELNSSSVARDFHKFVKRTIVEEFAMWQLLFSIEVTGRLAW